MLLSIEPLATTNAQRHKASKAAIADRERHIAEQAKVAPSAPFTVHPTAEQVADREKHIGTGNDPLGHVVREYLGKLALLTFVAPDIADQARTAAAACEKAASDYHSILDLGHEQVNELVDLIRARASALAEVERLAAELATDEAMLLSPESVSMEPAALFAMSNRVKFAAQMISDAQERSAQFATAIGVASKSSGISPTNVVKLILRDAKSERGDILDGAALAWHRRGLFDL